MRIKRKKKKKTTKLKSKYFDGLCDEITEDLVRFMHKLPPKKLERVQNRLRLMSR